LSEELASVLFTDVEGSTDYRTRRGDSAAHRRLQALHEVIAKEIEHHGGRVIKALGDGVLALFRSPRSAVTCSAAIQKEVAGLNRAHPDDALRVRIGINTGEVLEENNDVFGESVNAAARIAALAQGGQILVSAVLKDLVGTVPDVSFEDTGWHPLKGFTGEWHLYQVAVDESPHLVFLDKTPFVGRESELTQLERTLDQAARGRGGVVLVGGEPGVGKTRLAEEIALRAQQRGMLTFIGHCYEMEGALPYSPFVEILEATAETISADMFREIMGDSAPELARFAPQIKKMFPDIPPPADLPAEEDRRYTFNSISRYMRRAAAEAQIMLTLDDLHWGDDATLLLLEHLALNLQDVPVVIIGTYRDVELAVGRPLARTMELLVRQRAAQRLSLKRLTEQDVKNMLHRLSGSPPPDLLVAAIYSETEGNAFFVEEVFRHLLEEGKLLDANGIWHADLELDELDVPEGVRLVIGRRLERLGPETSKVLGAAAVIGRVFDFDLLPEIVDLAQLDPLDAMDEAERAHLITSIKGREARYSFVHELVRQTLLTDISLPRRQRLHLQIAEAIEARHSSDLDRHTSDLAHHLYQAGAAADPSKTITYLISAGDKAFKTAASEEALRAYEDALSLVDDDLQRARLLNKIGRARRGLRQWTEARVALHEALEIFERLQERDLVARTCQLLAERHFYLGEWQKAIEILDRPLQMPGEHSALTGGALALQSVGYSWFGRYEESLERLEESARVAEEVGHPLLDVGVLVSRAVHCHCFGRYAEGIEHGRKAAEFLRAAGLTWGLATVLGYVDFCLAVLGRWDESEELYDELWPLATRIGHTGSQLFALRWHEGFRFIQGDDVEAFAAAARADLEIALENESPWAADSYSWLGFCQLISGNFDEGLNLLEKGLEGANQGMWTGWHLGFLMWGLSHLGEREQVINYVPTVKEALLSGRARQTVGDIGLLGMGADGLAILGEWALVAELHGPSIKTLQDGSVWRLGTITPFAAIAAITCRAIGSNDDAERYFAEAHRVAGEVGGKYVSAEIDRLYGLALIDLGSKEEAARGRDLLDGAADAYVSIGLDRWATTVRGLR
jgi:class 3 adenylate cyclase/tetratricopeptide (TPR) repeat protein